MAPRRATAWPAGVLCVLGAMAVYVSPGAVLDGDLYGMDHAQLHQHRIDHAREALSQDGAIPAWSSREFLGAPFVANLQSFPLTPVRLVVLAVGGDSTYQVAVLLAAGLAALFTFLLARRLGLSPVGAGVAAWTFAASGFFASRVLAGHLPLLEAYPSLPMLLWLAERALSLGGRQEVWRSHLVLGIAVAATVLAGHPQLPAYAVAATLLYALARAPDRDGVFVSSTVMLGAALTLFAWVPMLDLASRSSRALALHPPSNDIAMPLWRLASLLVPGIDGWAAGHPRFTDDPWPGGGAYFWDTIAYVGALPLIVALVTLSYVLGTRQRPRGPVAIVGVLGAGAFLLSLSFFQGIWTLGPATVFRSPARLLYITTLAVAIVLGRFIDRLSRGGMPNLGKAAVVTLVILVHVADLGRFSRSFVLPAPSVQIPAAIQERLVSDGHEQRAAVDRWIPASIAGQIDDVGGFDSLILADAYRALLHLGGLDPWLNTQYLHGSTLDLPALQRTGVSHVLTHRDQPHLIEVNRFEDPHAGLLRLYEVPDPEPRTSFHPLETVTYVPDAELLPDRLDRDGELRLPLGAAASAHSGDGAPPEPRAGDPTVSYVRESDDRLTIHVRSVSGGWIRVVEAIHPGWTARLDGVPTEVWPADGFAMAVAVPPGDHEIVMTFRTRGRRLGVIGSLAALSWLALHLRGTRRSHHRSALSMSG